MTGSDAALLIGAALLILVAAVLVAIDAAITRVSRVVVEEFVREDRRGADKLAKVVAEPARYLNLLLLLRVFAELGAASLTTVSMVHEFGAGLAAVGVATLIMSLISYIILGVAFRTLGRQHAPVFALRTAWLTLALSRIFGPLPQLLIVFGNAITPGRGYREGPFSTEAELRDLVDLAEERGVVQRSERDMIASVFELGDTLAREVMVPRTDMVWIEQTKSISQGVALALRSGFSRIPVIGDSLDDVVGVAFLKDMVRRERDGWESRPLEAAMRPAYFVPESKPADDLLREMQARRQHLAIVIDEYGGTAGLVTIEDVLEEIVGEITDEYDQEVPPIERLDDHRVRVTARLPVEDLAELFGVELENESDVETVGGLLASLLGRVPIPGATAHIAGLELVAESTAGRRNRIDTVLATRQGPHEASEEAPADVRADTRADRTG
jgi:CBS domain containing-hemolysin-like protein